MNVYEKYQEINKTVQGTIIILRNVHTLRNRHKNIGFRLRTQDLRTYGHTDTGNTNGDKAILTSLFHL